MRACSVIDGSYILEEFASSVFRAETQCGRIHSIVPQKMKILRVPTCGNTQISYKTMFYIRVAVSLFRCWFVRAV